MSGQVASWTPRLGAIVHDEGTTFRVWAPSASRLELVLEDGRSMALLAEADGFFALAVKGLPAGTRYRYLVDGRGPFPDPVSRCQPTGVHGPSQLVNPSRFEWADHAWTGVAATDLVLYELHVGTFTPEGSFAAARERLTVLRDLGVTAVELMPLADFPGQRNWGYDGVSLFAPARCYGAPDELRGFVDKAHRLGLGVFVDVVYNHLGPDGNYLGVYSPHYFTDRHHTPWGLGANLDGPHSEHVRAFFIENAMHWLVEYHVDGLRLDATHALRDDSLRPFLAELAARAHALPGPRRLVIAEDERNLSALVRPEEEGGMGLDGVWADDFHHQMRRALAGDHDGYFADFTGTPTDIAETIARGFFYRGQTVARLGHPRGTDTARVPSRRFVFCLQNHDQVGNRALGERLHHQIDPAAYRAALTLLLLSPEIPLLFMGQEWAASSPFLYFTDHEPELGRKVTAGRREEFKAFAAFSSPELRARIPDPQSETTFVRSRLDWDERLREPGAAVWRLHRSLLACRRDSMRGVVQAQSCVALDGAIVLTYAESLVVVKLDGAGTVVVPIAGAATDFDIVLDTESPDFVTDARPIELSRAPGAFRIAFARPGALVLRRHADGGTT